MRAVLATLGVQATALGYVTLFDAGERMHDGPMGVAWIGCDQLAAERVGVLALAVGVGLLGLAAGGWLVALPAGCGVGLLGVVVGFGSLPAIVCAAVDTLGNCEGYTGGRVEGPRWQLALGGLLVVAALVGAVRARSRSMRSQVAFAALLSFTTVAVVVLAGPELNPSYARHPELYTWNLGCIAPHLDPPWPK
jgi:hypothetical protein